MSNLIHCFDQYSGFPFIHNFINEQNALLPKFRFKYAPVNDFFRSMMTNIQLVSEKNREVFPICLHDRTKLLCTTVEYTTFIGAAFILRQTELFNHPAFFNSAGLVFRPTAIAFIKRLIDRLDPDVTFLKIMITIIAFLASNYTVYMNTPSTNLMEAKAILRIQDTYTELVWRYLLYKYNFKEAVLCFSNFLRCILLLNDSIVEAHDTQSFTDIIDSVIESTKPKLTINR